MPSLGKHGVSKDAQSNSSPCCLVKALPDVTWAVFVGIAVFVPVGSQYGALSLPKRGSNIKVSRFLRFQDIDSPRCTTIIQDFKASKK